MDISQEVNKNIERRSASLVIRKTQSKSTETYKLTSTRRTRIKKKKTVTNIIKDVEETESSDGVIHFRQPNSNNKKLQK